jgi:hypothetical protein
VESAPEPSAIRQDRTLPPVRLDFRSVSAEEFTVGSGGFGRALVSVRLSRTVGRVSTREAEIMLALLGVGSRVAGERVGGAAGACSEVRARVATLDEVNWGRAGIWVGVGVGLGAGVGVGVEAGVNVTAR